MATAAMAGSASVPVLIILSCIILSGVEAATFTLVNSCSFTVWPGLQPNSGLALLADGGFELQAGAQKAVTAPAGWGGRFWGRTGCQFDANGKGTCETADCGGVLMCNGAGGNPPASLAEITLNGADGNDFYDLSLVDGYNLPLAMQPVGGSGNCSTPACTSNLNDNCPSELQVVVSGVVVACKSACEAFGDPQYCCTGNYNTSDTCKPTPYSMDFKAACPTAYSYAYDDPSSTFTCQAQTYTITFCPNGIA